MTPSWMTLRAAVDTEDVGSVDERNATERIVLAPTLGWTSGLASELSSRCWELNFTLPVLSRQDIRPQACVWTSVWATRTSRQITIFSTVGISVNEIDGLVLTRLDHCTRRPSEVPSSTTHNRSCGTPKRIELSVAPWTNVVPLFFAPCSTGDQCGSLTGVDTVLLLCFSLIFAFFCAQAIAVGEQLRMAPHPPRFLLHTYIDAH